MSDTNAKNSCGESRSSSYLPAADVLRVPDSDDCAVISFMISYS